MLSKGEVLQMVATRHACNARLTHPAGVFMGWRPALPTSYVPNAITDCPDFSSWRSTLPTVLPEEVWAQLYLALPTVPTC